MLHNQLAEDLEITGILLRKGNFLQKSSIDEAPPIFDFTPPLNVFSTAEELASKTTTPPLTPIFTNSLFSPGGPTSAPPIHIHSLKRDREALANFTSQVSFHFIIAERTL